MISIYRHDDEIFLEERDAGNLERVGFEAEEEEGGGSLLTIQTSGAPLSLSQTLFARNSLKVPGITRIHWYLAYNQNSLVPGITRIHWYLAFHQDDRGFPWCLISP